jgi:hypothetical protein
MHRVLLLVALQSQYVLTGHVLLCSDGSWRVTFTLVSTGFLYVES